MEKEEKIKTQKYKKHYIFIFLVFIIILLYVYITSIQTKETIITQPKIKEKKVPFFQ
jgi:hypothetical protein